MYIWRIVVYLGTIIYSVRNIGVYGFLDPLLELQTSVALTFNEVSSSL